MAHRDKGGNLVGGPPPGWPFVHAPREAEVLRRAETRGGKYALELQFRGKYWRVVGFTDGTQTSCAVRDNKSEAAKEFDRVVHRAAQIDGINYKEMSVGKQGS